MIRMATGQVSTTIVSTTWNTSSWAPTISPGSLSEVRMTMPPRTNGRPAKTSPIRESSESAQPCE